MLFNCQLVRQSWVEEGREELEVTRELCMYVCNFTGMDKSLQQIDRQKAVRRFSQLQLHQLPSTHKHTDTDRQRKTMG